MHKLDCVPARPYILLSKTAKSLAGVWDQG